MDADRISEFMKYLAAASSQTLNIDERMNLDLAFSQLSSSVKFEAFELWGKINGKQKTKFFNNCLTPFHFRNRGRLFCCCWHELHWAQWLPTTQVLLVHAAELLIQRVASAKDQLENCFWSGIDSFLGPALTRCRECRWNFWICQTPQRLVQSRRL